MKKILPILFLLLISSQIFGQFKDEMDTKISIRNGIGNNSQSSLFTGFFNPNNFQMNHSFSMSYSAFGNQGLALGVYTNSMSYKFTENLNVEVDASFVNSPYSSYGREHAKSLGGVYISRAQLNYKLSQNSNLMIQYRRIPNGYYSPFGYYSDSPFGW